MKLRRFFHAVCVILLLGCASPSVCLAQEQYNTVHQLSEEEIQEINNGDAVLVFNKDGYLSFLKGRFYDRSVEDYNQGIEALNGIARLLGIGKGSDFFCVYGESENGFVTFTYKQRYGANTIQNATIKIILDADGYPVGVSSSLSPNVGLSKEDDYRITAAEAEKVVRDEFEEDLKIYSEYTVKTAVTERCVTKHAWAVYSDNPNKNDDHVYMEHLIDYKGNYITSQPVFSMMGLQGDDVIQEKALSVFEGLQPAVYEGIVTCHDGSKREIKVSLAYSPVNGRYYLADLERHILAADYWGFLMEDQLNVWSSPDNQNWPDEYLITYESYQRIYDYYAERGMDSVDGFGMPVLILTDYCDEYGNQIQNAAYAGVKDGFALFFASTKGNYGECLDVIGHEFTHGVTEYCQGGTDYVNEPGAINEAISDIQGNICENILGIRDDEWLAGQQAGNPSRSLSDPNSKQLPTQINGTYYVSTDNVPTQYNDYNGLHQNSTVLGHIGWALYDRGMDLETEYRFWHTVTNLLTPKSRYPEVCAAMLLACDMNGLGDDWENIILDLWMDACAY